MWSQTEGIRALGTKRKVALTLAAKLEKRIFELGIKESEEGGHQAEKGEGTFGCFNMICDTE